MSKAPLEICVLFSFKGITSKQPTARADYMGLGLTYLILKLVVVTL